jgi:hypothetical protein
LCEKPSYVFGLYYPTEDSDPAIRTGLGRGQSRTFAYGLCVKCYQEEDVTEKVEERIADSLLQEANMRAKLDVAGLSYTNESMADGTRWINIKGKGEDSTRPE